MTCVHKLSTIGNRRWCTRSYSDGGCGGFWVLKDGHWRLQTTEWEHLWVAAMREATR